MTTKFSVNQAIILFWLLPVLVFRNAFFFSSKTLCLKHQIYYFFNKVRKSTLEIFNYKGFRITRFESCGHLVKVSLYVYLKNVKKLLFVCFFKHTNVQCSWQMSLNLSILH